MRRSFSVLVVALAALAIAACGADEETTGTAGTDPATTSTDATTSTETTTTSTSESTTTTTEPTTTTTTDENGLPLERCKDAESPPNIVNVISHGADCGAVAAAMDEIKSVSSEFRIGDFLCARVSGSELSGVWECRGEASFFTFDFGD